MQLEVTLEVEQWVLVVVVVQVLDLMVVQVEQVEQVEQTRVALMVVLLPVVVVEEGVEVEQLCTIQQPQALQILEEQEVQLEHQRMSS